MDLLDMKSTQKDRYDIPVETRADWLTVQCVVPIVEGAPGVPDEDRRRFIDWIRVRHSTDTLLTLIRHESSRVILARLEEEYAWYLESECDVYAVDLLCRTVIDENGTHIDEPLTPSQRIARAKDRVRQEKERRRGE